MSINNAIASGGSLALASYTSANTGGGETLQFGGTGNTSVTGAITPTSAGLKVTMQGTGKLTLAGDSSYAGGTAIGSGTVVANNVGGRSLGSGATTISGTGLLAGRGSTGGAVSLGITAGTATPGNTGTITAGSGGMTSDTAGTLTATAANFNGYGKYAWKLVHTAGTAGTDWDKLSLNTLLVGATSGRPFTIALTNGSDATGTMTTPTLKAGSTYGILQASDTTVEQLKTFLSAKAFVLDVSGFDGGIYQNGSYGLSASAFNGTAGSELDLTVNSAPEPASAALALVGATTLLGRRRHRNRAGFGGRLWSVVTEAA